MAQSNYATAARPRNQTTTLHAVEGELHEAVDRVNADGTTTRSEVTDKPDGRDYPVKGDPSRDTVATTRVDPRAVDIVNKKGRPRRQLHAFVVARMARPGRTQ